MPPRHRILRQLDLAELDFETAAPGDLDACWRALRACRRTAPPSRCGVLAGIAGRCSVRARPGSASNAPSWMHTRASCDSKSSRREEAHVVGGHHRHAVSTRATTARRDVDLLAGAPDALQFEVVAVAEHRLPARKRARASSSRPPPSGATHIAFAAAGQGDEPAERSRRRASRARAVGTPRC